MATDGLLWKNSLTPICWQAPRTDSIAISSLAEIIIILIDSFIGWYQGSEGRDGSSWNDPCPDSSLGRSDFIHVRADEFCYYGASTTGTCNNGCPFEPQVGTVMWWKLQTFISFHNCICFHSNLCIFQRTHSWSSESFSEWFRCVFTNSKMGVGQNSKDGRGCLFGVKSTKLLQNANFTSFSLRTPLRKCKTSEWNVIWILLCVKSFLFSWPDV